jgi:hypothetical protein
MRDRALMEPHYVRTFTLSDSPEPVIVAPDMRSVADLLREEDRMELAAFTPAERVRLALGLGERDLQLFRRASRPPLSREEAERALDRRRQLGRRSFRARETLTG